MDGPNKAARTARGGRGRGDARRRRLRGRHAAGDDKSVTVVGSWAAPSRSRSSRWSSRGRTGPATRSSTPVRADSGVPDDRGPSGTLPDLAGLPGPGEMQGFYEQGAEAARRRPRHEHLQGRDRAGLRRARHGRRWEDDRRLHQERPEGPHLVQHRQLRRRPDDWDAVIGADKGSAENVWCVALESGADSGWPAPTGSRTSSCARRARRLRRVGRRPAQVELA